MKISTCTFVWFYPMPNDNCVQVHAIDAYRLDVSQYRGDNAAIREELRRCVSCLIDSPPEGMLLELSDYGSALQVVVFDHKMDAAEVEETLSLFGSCTFGRPEKGDSFGKSRLYKLVPSIVGFNRYDKAS